MRALLLLPALAITACATASDPMPESSDVYLCGDVEAMLGTRGEDVRLFLPEGDVALSTVSDDSFRGDLNGRMVKFARTDFGRMASLSVGETAYPVCEKIS